MGRVKDLGLLRGIVAQVEYMTYFVGDPSGNQVAAELAPRVTSRSTVYRYLIWGYKLGLLDYVHEGGAYFWRATPRGLKFLNDWRLVKTYGIAPDEDSVWGESGLPANE